MLRQKGVHLARKKNQKAVWPGPRALSLQLCPFRGAACCASIEQHFSHVVLCNPCFLTSVPLLHSYRSATIGSTFVALRAGAYPASKVTAATMKTAVMSVNRSDGLRPKRM